MKNSKDAMYHSRIDRFFKLSPNPMLEVKRSGMITLANDAAAEFFQNPMLIGSHIGSQDKQLDENFEEHIYSKELTTLEVTLNKKTFLFHFAPISSDITNVYGVDITENKNLNALLMQNSKLASIGQLAAGVAHEINNPLGIALGNVELLQSAIHEKSLDLNILDKLTDSQFRAIERIAKIVNNLRMFARRSDEVETFSCHTTLQELISIFESIMRGKGVELVIDLKASNTLVEGHKDRLLQVLVNLLNNAADATEGRPKRLIRVNTKNMSDGDVSITVEDNGKGIPKNQLEKIFDSFFTTKDRKSGTGLGLSISHSIVAEMKGMLLVESEVNVGTKFEIRLPISSKVRSIKKKLAPEYVMSGRVVAIDDEKELLESYDLLLRGAGFTVTCFEDPTIAIEYIKRNDVDILLTDFNLGLVSGAEVIDQVKAVSRCKVILMTGDDLSLTDSKEDKLMLKPFTREELLQAIYELLSESIPAAK